MLPTTHSPGTSDAGGSGSNGAATSAAAALRLRASVELDGERIDARLIDARGEALELFSELPATAREQLALDAWRIGLSAVSAAYRKAEASTLQEIGRGVVRDFEHASTAVLDAIAKQLQTALTAHFDPQAGQLEQRLRRFADERGELARAMRQVLDSYLSPGSGALAQLLEQRLGQQSPLLRLLDPDSKQGVLQHMAELVREALRSRDGEISRALDPLNNQGPVGRFLEALRNQLEQAHRDREQQLEAALAALDANDEQSLLNRLVNETTSLQEKLLQALNGDHADSPLAQIKASLSGLLSEKMEEQGKALAEHHRRQQQLAAEVREAVTRLETRREEQGHSAQGGHAFEDAVSCFVSQATHSAPVLVERTGSSCGLLPRCKKGDLVLGFTAESAFQGARIVVEAKRDASYTVSKALAEMELARKNRNADAGLFVMAASHAPDSFPRWRRYGRDVLVIWDEQDPATDLRLETTLSLALALAPRKSQAAADSEITALSDVHQRVEQIMRDLDKIEGANERIQRNSEAIAETSRKQRKKLRLLLRKAEQVLEALDVALDDVQAERESPIGLDDAGEPATMRKPA